MQEQSGFHHLLHTGRGARDNTLAPWLHTLLRLPLGFKCAAFWKLGTHTVKCQRWQSCWGVDLQAPLKRLVNHRQCAWVRILKLIVGFLDHDTPGAVDNVRTMYTAGGLVQVVPFTVTDNVILAFHNLGS